jgi:subtilase family serine protease
MDLVVIAPRNPFVASINRSFTLTAAAMFIAVGKESLEVAAYEQGLNGKGQTIVLPEAYGYPTIEHDANAFFKLAGLPQLDSSNFQIVYP